MSYAEDRRDPNNFSNVQGGQQNTDGYGRPTGGAQMNVVGATDFQGQTGYPGNTSDSNTFGTGGGFDSQPAGADWNNTTQSGAGIGNTQDRFDNSSQWDQNQNQGQQRQRDPSQWQQNQRQGDQGYYDQQGQQGNWGSDNNYDNNTSTGRTGKPSMGSRIKGNMEVAAGKVTGNPNMVERGEDRKTGDQF